MCQISSVMGRPLQWGQPACGIAFDQFFLSLFMGSQVKWVFDKERCVTCPISTTYMSIFHARLDRVLSPCLACAWSTGMAKNDPWDGLRSHQDSLFERYQGHEPKRGRGHRESTENSFSGCSLMFLTQIILAIMTILGISGDISPHTSLNTVLLLNIFQASPVRCPISRPFPRTDPLWSIALVSLGMWYFSAFFPSLFFFGD